MLTKLYLKGEIQRSKIQFAWEAHKKVVLKWEEDYLKKKHINPVYSKLSLSSDLHM